MAITLGYALSSEEHSPAKLVRQSALAEEAGFSFALISDHFHPWTDQQGESPFVWSVLGGIASATTTLRVGTGVTCPLLRIHPAIVAHAAATTAAMMPGRFFLGVGTGEALNEHILCQRWPPTWERRDRLAEAVDVMRALWDGDLTTYVGEYYRVDNARLYTLPEEAVDVYVAAGGPAAAGLAAQVGDGLICTTPSAEFVEAFDTADGEGPRYGQVTVCWAPTEQEGIEMAHRWWPNGALRGTLNQELPLPSHFESAAEMVSEDDIAASVVCGSDPERHIAAVRAYEDAGFDHVYVHQVGPRQQDFMNFYRDEVMPAVTA